MDLKEEEILGESIYGHWYYIAKGRALRSFLDGYSCDEVLDVGAGSGIFSKQLLDHGVCGRAVCVDPGYKKEYQDIYNGKSIDFVKSIDKTTQKLILMMDVLEHVSDDVNLLKSYAETMPTGSKVLITVPAFQFLWSGHDVFLEHYRRYTISQLEKTVHQAGLTPVKSRYFFGVLFPAIAIMRCIRRLLNGDPEKNAKSDMRLYPDWLNKSLITIHDIERKILFPCNKVMGLSVFCLCEKR